MPGKPDESLLLDYVDSGEMPRDRPALSDAEKQRLRRWIADGAKWGTAEIDPFLVTTDRRAGYDWWSLQPVRTPAPPAVRDARWSRNGIDRFVLARLEARDLHPAAEADRRTLIRRLSFDLIGLPPEPGDVERFVADTAADAYEKLVDRLLASPHYGERWGRHWLDVVRFGESEGFERNHVRDNAWRYRDWVVQAFNRDLPYDEFVRQQIAGDVLHPDDLGALIATGYHVCGTWDEVAHYEGSSEMQKATRFDELEDLVAHARADLPRADDQLRPLPRSQVRPDLAEGVLPGRGPARGREPGEGGAIEDRAGRRRPASPASPASRT